MIDSTVPGRGGNEPTGSNKKLILDAFAEFARGNHQILREVLHEDFIEHSPGNPSGRDAFAEYAASMPIANADVEVRRVIADGDLVVVHYLMTPQDGGRGAVVADIWRLDDGLIAEHWDVVQPVPEPELTPNGMI